MKTVFITGAASGIGLMTAKLFAKKGYFVGLYDINNDVIETQLASGEFPNACGCYCDVSNAESVQEALKHFTKHTEGKINILINNAGVLTSGFFEEIQAKQHESMIDVNIKGVTTVAQLAYPYLKATPNSLLVNTCSASSIHGIPYLAVYSASKFYVDGLSEALSIEWQTDDIRVISIKPPVIDTAMGASLHPNLTKNMPIEFSSEDVAQFIFNTINGNKTSYIIDFKTKAWVFINRFLSAGARMKLVKYLCNFEK